MTHGIFSTLEEEGAFKRIHSFEERVLIVQEMIQCTSDKVAVVFEKSLENIGDFFGYNVCTMGKNVTILSIKEMIRENLPQKERDSVDIVLDARRFILDENRTIGEVGNECKEEDGFLYVRVSKMSLVHDKKRRKID